MATLRETKANADNTPEEDYNSWDYVWGTTGNDSQQQEAESPSPNISDPKDTSQAAEIPYQNPQTSRVSNWPVRGGGETVVNELNPGSIPPAANYPLGVVTEQTGGSPYNWANKYRSAGGAVTPAAKPYATITENKRMMKSGAQWPTFTAPTWNEGEVKKRQREIAAPASREMEMKVQQAMSRYYENPNVRRAALASTLAGYGVGLSHIMAQAKTGARAEYQADYSRQYGEAMNAYNLAMQKMATQATTVTSQQSFATKGDYETWKSQYSEI